MRPCRSVEPGARELEHLIELPDPDLYAALTGDRVLPAEYATALYARIKAFRVADHGA